MNTTSLAHQFWSHLISPGNLLIDATCGNGKDTFFLARLLKGQGQVISYDIQKEALVNARILVSQLEENERQIIVFKHKSHEAFDEKMVNGIIYNLGYLPGGNHALTTQTETTLKSLTNGLEIVTPGGFISIALYPGHAEGERESLSLMQFCEQLPKELWSVLHLNWLNRSKAPSLLLLTRSRSPSYKNSHTQEPFVHSLVG